MFDLRPGGLPSGYSYRAAMILAASRLGKKWILATQNLKKLFKFHAYLLDYLLTLRDI